MGRDQELKWLAFSLYPLSFFLYCPFKQITKSLVTFHNCSIFFLPDSFRKGLTEPFLKLERVRKPISNFWKLRARQNPRYIRWNLSEPKLPLDVKWLIWINFTWNTRLVSEFNEFEPRLKSPKNRFQLSTGLNLEKLNTILSGTNNIYAVAQIL